MTHETIINIILNHKPYKRYCDKLCRDNNTMSDDLYQEFFMLMFEKKETDLISLFDSGYLQNYCLAVIYNKNKDRFRNTGGAHGNPLSTITNIGLFEYHNKESITYDHSIDENFNNIMDYLKTDTTIKEEDVTVLSASIDTKLIDISRLTGIPYITLKTKRKRIKDKIKANVKIWTY